MTAIKHTLQREVFLPSEERLAAVVHVTRVGKKKKPSFLCAAVTTEKPVQALVYEVKKSERGDNHFKKKSSWPLRDLKFLDAKDASGDMSEFDVQFDKLYKWSASTVTERNAFIQCLWKQSRRYLVQKPEFRNVPPGVLEDVSQPSEADQAAEAADGLGGEADYQVLSAQEEEDLASMMSQCDFAISNAEAFAEQLAKDLSVLDGANIHSIMGSEDQVLELMGLIDQALNEAGNVETKLTVYDHKLQTVKELMEVMKDKDTLLQVRNNNHQRLLEELDGVITQLDLDSKHVKALNSASFTSSQAIMQCTHAANALQRCLTADISPALLQMTAVQEQKKKFIKYKENFAVTLSRQLNNLFVHQGNDPGESLSRYANDLKLPQHHASHHDLLPYADLMLWLKVSDETSFDKLAKTYSRSLQKLYTRDVKEFMDAGKQKIAPRLERRGLDMSSSRSRSSSRSSLSGKEENSMFYGHSPKKLGTLPGGQRLQAGSSSSINKMADGRLRAGSSVGLEADAIRASDTDIANRKKFDLLFETVLSELEPWCLAEQKFCEKFFHLSPADDFTEDDSPLDSSLDGPGSKRRATRERQISDEVRKMMASLFPTLETELMTFVSFGDRLDSFNSLYMLVRMSQHVSNAQDKGSFLSKTYGQGLIQIKRNFDNFVNVQQENMTECKLSKKGKAGILPFVHAFEEFATQAETIFRDSDRRTDLDKAYNRLVHSIFEHISRVASESYKTPTDVVKFENFHHLFGVLSRLKITSLEQQRKEAKNRYLEHLQAYVTLYLGRPMEKLSIFFEGVETKVAQGVKAEEISYQLAYSKQELRKLVKEYPGKEVKKNLEHLYKKVEKHLCEEESLLQVVWVRMQDEFLKQYKHFELLINQCYPDAAVTFEFTINDLLSYFSDIARSH